MTTKELKEYLNRFPDNTNISLILANPRKRKLYEVVYAFGIIYAQNPVFCIDVGKESDMDAELVAACEEAENIAGQINIYDYPEIVPTNLE